ncbi:MAG TPA: type II toxin-antitoxin system HicA family toxin [Bryobacteraceae bacterium]
MVFTFHAWKPSQYKHPVKKGRVTIPGKPGDDVTPPTFASALKQAKIKKPS